MAFGFLPLLLLLNDGAFQFCLAAGRGRVRVLVVLALLVAGGQGVVPAYFAFDLGDFGGLFERDKGAAGHG